MIILHCKICFDVYPKSQWTSDFSREILAEARRPEFCFKVEIVLLLLRMTGYQDLFHSVIPITSPNDDALMTFDSTPGYG